MATISASLFTALDGVVDPAVGNWHFPYFNDEMGSAVDRTHAADVMLFGRVTYEGFAGAWPERETAGGEDAEFAKRLGDMRKIVASRSPRELTWRNSEQLLPADPEDEPTFLAGARHILRSGFDPQRFPTFCAVLVAGTSLLHVKSPAKSFYFFWKLFSFE